MNEKLTQSIEDYIETIYLDYSKEGKGVRVTDLATAMKVTKASANDAVRKLKEMGYVEHERYGQIYLTEAGKTKGMAIYEKHCLIMRFLTDVLKVSAPVAEADACNIEHIISDETFEKLKGFLNAD
ncbi:MULTISPECIES: metal-dependent transcriptional regulator [Eubacterium]|uniref:Mn-dependent transcriptional regulator, DtxR family n=1 Tax=Eubacterium barkeri TaxID=1528 RepID=A0A1H3BSF2_EUBBA|nr:metal-dependent transcriptional regulator [Eubacterium barkeri]SDX44109.1 Mn-dependent transcriptional regulator, DtxR family [Eubacterium barkeri]